MDTFFEKQERASGHIIRAFENLKRLGQANVTLGVIEAKISVIDAKWQAFVELHEKIEEVATAEDRKKPYFAADVYASTEDGYYLSKGKFLDLTRRFTAKDEPAAKPALSMHQLPKINLPKFSGEFTEWPSFRDLLASMVGDNDSLSPVEKMHYLKTSLSSEPAALLASVPLTADNLETAWKMLTDRYENKRLLTAAQISRICSLQPMTAELAAELKTLFNGTVNAVSALRALGRPVDGYDDFLVYLTVRNLDQQSRREWETAMGAKKSPPTFAELRTFLEARICAVQALEPTPTPPAPKTSGAPATQGKAGGKSSSTTSRVRSHQASGAPAAGKRCPLCKQDHFVIFCDSFRSKSAEERRSFILGNNLCLNCLGRHFVRECRSPKTCQICHEKHHTMIHEASTKPSGSLAAAASGSSGIVSLQSSSQSRPNLSVSDEVSAHSAQCSISRSPVRALLATAVVNVFTAGGTPVSVRALLDQGSEVSFAAESLVQRLRLPRASASVAVTGIGAKSAGTSRGRVTLTMSSRLDTRFEVEVDAFILPRVTADVPPRSASVHQWSHLDGLDFADPDLSSSRQVELLLGADIFARLLLPSVGVRMGPADAPVAQKTQLGWIQSGGAAGHRGNDSTSASLQLSVDRSLTSSLQRFWEQEEIRTTLPLSTEERACEEHFVSTHSRNPDGRYVVRLPLKEPITDLGDSFFAASRMLCRMEHRCSRESRFGEAYTAFLAEYEKLGHMARVEPSLPEPSRVYYLPHHGVIRESSETTKLRVVFNGSQKTSRGISLNEYLHVGPKLLPDLFDILLRWRAHAVVFSSDMEKMYRQVLVHPSDRDLQRILWRTGARIEPDAYRLSTVTYGLACAPYLAIRVVRQLAVDERARFPLGSAALLTDVYVDEVLSGADDVPSALAKQRELVELLKAGGFTLRKWTSNSPDLLSHLQPADLASGTSFVVPSESSFHMLGLKWQADSDSFVFHLKHRQATLPLTKRTVLSNIAELFDPLGWLAPVVVRAKIFMQSLWLLKLGRDEPLPDAASRDWLAFYEDLPQISRYRIPRWLRLCSTSRDIELHGFSDASERAYAAVVYLCVTGRSRSVTLVAAKSKVAPVKQVSLPRLELCAAELLTRLAKHVLESLSLACCAVHLWSDSTVTLAWIRDHPVRWKTYVANRVSEIQRALPDAVWHHVNSEENPADCASRGIQASDLLGHALWWTGPQWLLRPSREWPKGPSVECIAPPELRVLSHVAAPKPDDPGELVRRYSSLTRLLRITAWCRRFLGNSRIHDDPPEGERQLASTLLPAELSSAFTCLVKVEQARFFKNEITALKAQDTVQKGPLLRLNPVLDGDGQVRVGGRLRHSILDADEKHPVIIPHDSPLTPLLIDRAHRQTLHGGLSLRSRC